MTDDKIVPLNPPPPPPGKPVEGVFAEGIDWEGAYNSREWVSDALKAKGAKITGGGFGAGGSDLDIEIEGHPFHISIRPVER